MRMIALLSLAPALALFDAPPALAAWRLASQDGFSTIYFDPASRQTLSDESVSLLALTDYDPQSSEAKGFRLSDKGLSEIETVRFDCARKAYRSDGGKWYEGHVATGAVRSAYPAKTEWSGVPPYYAALFSTICDAAGR